VHELSLVAELVEACTRRAGGAPVSLVRVRCATTVPEAALRESFRLLAAGGPLAGAVLEVEPLAVPPACPCGSTAAPTDVDVVGHLVVCPSCGAVTAHTATTGLELLEVG
jgi:Zn finger protein HypA/HybF involved in hydrogenase expression